MAHSLELRSPLLDHRVVELGLSLPDRLKQRGREGKVALRRAFADDLPPSSSRRAARAASACRSPRGSAASCGRSRTTLLLDERARVARLVPRRAPSSACSTSTPADAPTTGTGSGRS